MSKAAWLVRHGTDVQPNMNLINIVRPAVLALRKFGPYALTELVMPGGTILALLLFLYRHRTNAAPIGLSHPSIFLAGCQTLNLK